MSSVCSLAISLLMVLLHWLPSAQTRGVFGHLTIGTAAALAAICPDSRCIWPSHHWHCCTGCHLPRLEVYLATSPLVLLLHWLPSAQTRGVFGHLTIGTAALAAICPDSRCIWSSHHWYCCCTGCHMFSLEAYLASHHWYCCTGCHLPRLEVYLVIFCAIIYLHRTATVFDDDFFGFSSDGCPIGHSAHRLLYFYTVNIYDCHSTGLSFTYMCMHVAIQV